MNGNESRGTSTKEAVESRFLYTKCSKEQTTTSRADENGEPAMEGTSERNAHIKFMAICLHIFPSASYSQ